MSTLRREVFYPHPVEDVWQALTDPDALSTWLMPTDFVAELGHQFTLRTSPGPGFDGVIRCQVVEFEPPRRMAWSWSGGPIDTVLRFEVKAEGSGTRLHFEQSGFSGFQGNIVRLILGAGFRTIYRRKLPAYLLGEGVRPEAEDRSRLGSAFARLTAPMTRKN